MGTLGRKAWPRQPCCTGLYCP